MPAPSLTYTITNNTTADASHVMQNFNDILNGITDGTKDISVSALTAAGATTLNGAVNIGSASDDNVAFNGSLTTDIVPSTAGARSLGSAALGFVGLYLAASGDGDTARVIAAAHSADRDYTIPDAGAAASFMMTAGAQTATGLQTFSGGYKGNVPCIITASINPFTSGGSGSPTTRTETLLPSWVSSTSWAGGGAAASTGTLTINITQVGYYRLVVRIHAGASSAWTGALLMRNIYGAGGTATIYDGSGGTSESFTSIAPTNDSTFVSERIVQVTANPQSVVINSFVNGTATTPIGYFTWVLVPF